MPRIYVNYIVIIKSITRKNKDTFETFETLKKNIVITKFDKGNGVVILDRKLYNNTIQEIISNTSKFKKLNEDPILKREALLQHFLRKLKQKSLF